jgi:hypothetical protein
MKVTLSAFLGANRAKHPLDLPEGVGVLSLNQNPVRGNLRPWRAPVTVATVPQNRKTIYRMGRGLASDSQYWLSWPTVVHVVQASEPDDTTERTYYTGDGPPKWTDNTKALASAPYPVAWRTLGVPAPTAAVTLVASGGVSPNTETRSYTFTFVNDVGHEGAQAPVSVDLICKTDATVMIGNIQAPPSGAYFINRVRIYRTQSGTSGDTEFFLAREIPAGQPTTSDDGRLNPDVLTTSLYLMPPEDLHYLTAMWNGMLAGISGNAVRVCVSNKYYAWPMAYEVLPTDAKPVALAKFGEASLLILTTGKPLLVTGSTPDALDAAPLGINEACIAPQSVVSFGHGVMWACPDGLAYYGNGRAPGIITNGLMTKDDWANINPRSIIASNYEGAYMGSYLAGETRVGFFIDPLNPTGIYFTDIPAEAVYFDEFQDQLFIMHQGNIKRWDTGDKLLATFGSKTYRTPVPTSFACAKVIADSYPVSVTFYCDNVPPAQVTAMLAMNPLLGSLSADRIHYGVVVNSAEAFYLPPLTHTQWQIELSTTDAVQGVAMAESMDELATL